MKKNKFFTQIIKGAQSISNQTLPLKNQKLTKEKLKTGREVETPAAPHHNQTDYNAAYYSQYYNGFYYPKAYNSYNYSPIQYPNNQISDTASLHANNTRIENYNNVVQKSPNYTNSVYNPNHYEQGSTLRNLQYAIPLANNSYVYLNDTSRVLLNDFSYVASPCTKPNHSTCSTTANDSAESSKSSNNCCYGDSYEKFKQVTEGNATNLMPRSLNSKQNLQNTSLMRQFASTEGAENVRIQRYLEANSGSKLQGWNQSNSDYNYYQSSLNQQIPNTYEMSVSDMRTVNRSAESQIYAEAKQLEVNTFAGLNSTRSGGNQTPHSSYQELLKRVNFKDYNITGTLNPKFIESSHNNQFFRMPQQNAIVQKVAKEKMIRRSCAEDRVNKEMKLYTEAKLAAVRPQGDIESVTEAELKSRRTTIVDAIKDINLRTKRNVDSRDDRGSDSHRFMTSKKNTGINFSCKKDLESARREPYSDQTRSKTNSKLSESCEAEINYDLITPTSFDVALGPTNLNLKTKNNYSIETNSSICPKELYLETEKNVKTNYASKTKINSGLKEKRCVNLKKKIEASEYFEANRNSNAVESLNSRKTFDTEAENNSSKRNSAFIRKKHIFETKNNYYMDAKKEAISDIEINNNIATKKEVVSKSQRDFLLGGKRDCNLEIKNLAEIRTPTNVFSERDSKIGFDLSLESNLASEKNLNTRINSTETGDFGVEIYSDADLYTDLRQNYDLEVKNNLDSESDRECESDKEIKSDSNKEMKSDMYKKMRNIHRKSNLAPKKSLYIEAKKCSNLKSKKDFILKTQQNLKEKKNSNLQAKTHSRDLMQNENLDVMKDAKTEDFKLETEKNVEQEKENCVELEAERNKDAEEEKNQAAKSLNSKIYQNLDLNYLESAKSNNEKQWVTKKFVLTNIQSKGSRSHRENRLKSVEACASQKMKTASSGETNKTRRAAEEKRFTRLHANTVNLDQGYQKSQKLLLPSFPLPEQNVDKAIYSRHIAMSANYANYAVPDYCEQIAACAWENTAISNRNLNAKVTFLQHRNPVFQPMKRLDSNEESDCGSVTCLC